MTARYGYRRWDGTQDFADLDVDDLLADITDDILSGGDPADALRRVLRSGVRMPDGSRLPGLRDIIEKIRRRRAELLAQGSPGSWMAQVAARLEEIVATERAALDEAEAADPGGGDPARREGLVERQIALDLMADDLAGRVRDLQGYDFVSPEARQEFGELVDQLRAEVAETYFANATRALGSMDQAALDKMRHAYDALNRMLEQRQAGEDLDPSFEEFMARFGDMFPDAGSLDELLEQLAARMAAAEAMWRSLSPDQKDQLRQLADSLLEDMDLRWQVDRLAANLGAVLPAMGSPEGYAFSGDAPLGPAAATDLASQLASLERMEEVLQSASSPAALGEVDMDEVARHLGAEDAAALDRLSRLAEALTDAGYVEQSGGRLELTAAGARRLGQRALADLFSQMRRDHLGGHGAAWVGTGHDREEITKPYEYGDPLNLHLSATVHNAVRRAGRGTPVHLQVEDFAVVETEALARAATVVLVDLSMSMPMRDNFLPAKKMAMALQTLIASKFPRDYLGIVGFSEVAREITPRGLPTAMWDYVYGTNLQHGLILARRMLAHQHGTKQVIVVTDGEPTAHIQPSGEVLFHYPPLEETLQLTMAEVVRCTRAGITINVFALDLERTLFPFVEQIARVNGGRTFYTSPGALGSYVLVDFLRHRRVFRHAG